MSVEDEDRVRRFLRFTTRVHHVAYDVRKDYGSIRWFYKGVGVQLQWMFFLRTGTEFSPRADMTYLEFYFNDFVPAATWTMSDARGDGHAYGYAPFHYNGAAVEGARGCVEAVGPKRTTLEQNPTKQVHRIEGLIRRLRSSGCTWTPLDAFPVLIERWVAP